MSSPSKETSFLDSFQSATWSEIREKMKKGEKVSGCRRCYQEEEAGKKSLRQRYNNNASIGLSQVDRDSPQLKWLEIPLSNRCNLACRMCDSRYSTRWLKDEKAIYGKTFGEDRVVDLNWEAFTQVAPHLRHIKITGGEPLMDPAHKKLLKYLLEKGNPEKTYLNYSTNLTFFPDEETLSAWNHFEKVELALSLDSHCPRELNYIRYPSKGDQVLENLDKFMNLVNDLSNLYLILRTTVSLFNIASMPDTLNRWSEKQRNWVSKNARDRVLANATHLTEPAYLAPQVLPLAIKQRILEAYNKKSLPKDWSGAKTMDYLHNIMMSEDQSSLWPEFIEKTQKLDQLRKQSYQEIFPHLSDSPHGEGEAGRRDHVVLRY